MRMLYHHPLSPASRRVRIALAEKGLDCAFTVEKPWERREEFLALDPAGDVPVLVEDDAVVVVGNAILEYLEECHPDPPLLPGGPEQRAEIRRLATWFDGKFDREVTENLVGEKVIKRLSRQGHPNGLAIRAGLANIHYHLDYVAFLSERRNWLGGDSFSLADIAAAAQLSVIDYIDLVPWDNHSDAKDWYARIKSRPSFRSVLADLVPGVLPPAHYADLDF
ncbi:MAG: glutathione S-transferase family protein [Azospirillum sp.]|nr:glutathione S-transferase family protein [Azospirillum sp.]